jgi:guanylate kinase
MNTNNGVLLTLTGPSGSGKTLLIHELCENHNFSKLVSVTTRFPRPGEIEGKDYYFITPDEFARLEQSDNLVQATVFNGVSYGTTKTELERVAALGKVPAVIVEPTGIPQFQQICDVQGYQLKTIFLTAYPETLIARYLGRLYDTDVDMWDKLEYHAKRIYAIKDETEWGTTWPFDMKFINNGTDIKNIARIAETIGELYGSES